MECSVQELDELCARLDRAAGALVAAAGTPAPQEEQLVAEVVLLTQRVGEVIAWAYGQHRRVGLGEAFAQPFVDRRMRDRLKLLLSERRGFRVDLHNKVAAQVLQTIHILLQALPAESTLFCNLTAGWYLNDVAATRLDFRQNDDLLPLWMTVVKDIATMVNKDNMMLFFDPTSKTPFPIFSEVWRFYHHPVSQVRTHVQAISLEIFMKLRDKDVWSEPLFQLVLTESAGFFTHVCCLLRDFWSLADVAFRAGARRDLRNALYIQNDILMYINDVLECDIPQLGKVIEEKLLRFAVVPVLLRSVARQRPSAAASRSEPQCELQSPPVIFYLLNDVLSTLHSPATFESIAGVLLRSTLPEEALRLASGPPPRTPARYITVQASWGPPRQPSPFDQGGAQMPDEALYAVPATTLAQCLRAHGSGGYAGPCSRNWLLEALEEWVRSLDHAAERAALAPMLLGAAARLLAAMRGAGEVLDVAVAERIGSALSQALSIHHQLQWSTLSAAFRTLQEVASAADVPPGRAWHVLIPPLRERVLHPLASDLHTVLRRYGGDVQEAWVQEFQEQWLQDQSALWLAPEAMQRRELLELNAEPELPGAAQGRTNCMRVLLGTWRFSAALSAAGGQHVGRRMPGLSDDEADEISRYQPGLPVYIGKMNRVKCLAKGLCPGPIGAAEEDSLYLLSTKGALVLVRPDDQKPFWAVPVVSESLRGVRLLLGDVRPGGHPAGGPDEERMLHIELPAARSPALASPGAGATALLGGFAACNGQAGLLRAGSSALPGHERLATSTPVWPGLQQAAPAAAGAARAASLTLVFSDERRCRVACKILAQAHQAVYLTLLEGLGAFLTEVAGG